MDLPDWLLERRIGDELFAQAYDETSPKARAALKTGIAIAHQYYGVAPSGQKQAISHASSGLVITTSAKPADWAAICIGRNWAGGAAPILAAAILPLLCGIDSVFGIVAQPPALEMLISLEMCGIRDVFAFEEGGLAQAIQDIASGLPNGRMVTLNSNATAIKTCQAPRSKNRAPAPGLALCADPDAFDSEILSFCYGELLRYHAQDCACWHCVLARPDNAACMSAQLRLAPGCEGFWLFDDLSPEFYADRSVTFEKILECE